MQYAVKPGQIVASDPAPYHLTGNTWPIPDLSAPQSGYAFAQTPDSTPPTFVSSELDPTTRVLTITFSETIDATNVDAAKIHIRESGNYTGGGITLTAVELGTAADASTISFTLTVPRLATVTGLTTPELTIEPGAVQDTSENLIVSTFDVSTATHVYSFSVSDEDIQPTGMAFSNNGYKMFMVGSSNDKINEYTLTTPFDLSTATHVYSFSVSDEDILPTGMAFSNNGTKMFVVGNAGDDISVYNLTAPFDVSTASYNSDIERFTVLAPETSPQGMAFSNNGLKMFVVGWYDEDINEYTLDTPFDVSTATHVYSFSVSSQDSEPTGMAFSNNGIKMFVVGDVGNEINEYTLDTPFDVSIVKHDHTLSVSDEDTEPTGMAFSNDGAKMFVIGAVGDDINEYTLSSVYPITVTVRDVNVAPVLNTIDDQTVNEFVELTFTATASDDDALIFSLDGTVPSGAAITDDGNFTWTPTESQDGDHTITVQVTDGSLTDSETLTVTVNEVNVAPVLNTIDDQTVNELVELTFTATASDTDVVDNVVNTLTFSFDGTVPSGAAITSAGVFTWIPTESQVGSHDITVQVTDGSLTDSETLTVTVRDVNVAPVLNTIDDQTVNEFVELTFTATASDDDALIFSLDGTVPSGAAITDDGNFTWTPTESQDGDHTITVQVTDGSLTDSETLTVTVNEVNVAPVLNTIDDQTVNELVELTFTATASDTDVVDNVVNTLTFSFDGTVPSGAAITSAGVFTWIPTESQVGSHDITVQVTDGSLTDSETLTVTVKDTTAPVIMLTGLTSIQLTVDETYTELGATCEDNVDADKPATEGGDTVDTSTVGQYTVTYDCTDTAGNDATQVLRTVNIQAESDTPTPDTTETGSNKKPSFPPIVIDIHALVQSRLVDIPPHITEQVESHDASDPLEPITPDGTFDLPLVINGYGYLLDAYENTLIPQTVTAGDNPVHITFTVYTEKEFAHFILYLNLQGRNTNYADSDTYITYKDDGTTSVTDQHGYIGSATVTVTQEDDQIPEKRTVRITIEFGEEPMGPTNMVAYMWNTDRKALFVKIIDALEVVAASPESAMQAADPEPDSVLPADPEPVTPDFADDAADPEPVPYDILGPDDYDDTQILQIIRMWSGFESESITDAQLLELLGLDDHQGADIPDWMMTELGVLVAKGTVTVDEFLVALQYVLEHD